MALIEHEYIRISYVISYGHALILLQAFFLGHYIMSSFHLNLLGNKIILFSFLDHKWLGPECLV